MGILNKLFSSKASKVFPPIPKWKPNLPVNYELIVDRAKYYTDQKLQFAIFEQGTVVYFSELVEGVELQAISRLDQIYRSMPDMKPLTMDDGNYPKF